jgi:hypothetical protein
MKRHVGTVSTHPFFLNAINLSLLILAYTAFKFTFHSSISDSAAIHEATEIWEGFGTIILGYGVLLEERTGLRKIFGLTEGEKRHADICHDFGVYFVLLGVLIETLAWLIKIPNAVLDYPIFEFGLLMMAAVAGVWSVGLQVWFAWRWVKK